MVSFRAWRLVFDPNCERKNEWKWVHNPVKFGYLHAGLPHILADWYIWVYVNKEYICNGCCIVIFTNVDNYVLFILNSTVTILMDTVLLTAFHQFITVGPCRHTWLSSENVLSDNVLPKVFLLDEIAGRIKASLVPLNCQISMPFNQHIYNGIHHRWCRAHHWQIRSLCRKFCRLPNWCGSTNAVMTPFRRVLSLLLLSRQSLSNIGWNHGQMDSY